MEGVIACLGSIFLQNCVSIGATKALVISKSDQIHQYVWGTLEHLPKLLTLALRGTPLGRTGHSRDEVGISTCE